MYEWDFGSLFLIFAAGALVIVLLLAKLIDFIIEFALELRYLNSEISRTVGSERKSWLRQRRKLWLSLIPFVKY